MPAAKTGRDKSSKMAVKKTDQTNNGTRCQNMLGVLMLMMVVMKLMAPKIEEAPARCKLKIAKSTAAPG
jgi:hypothetical protein